MPDGQSETAEGTGGEPAGDEQPRQRRATQAAAATQNEPADNAQFGAIVFGLVSVGLFFVSLFGNLLGDEEAAIVSEGDEALFESVITTLDTIVGPIGLVVAGAVAIYYVRTTDKAQTAAAIAIAAGAFGVSILFLLLAVVFEPDFVEVDIGTELPGILGAVVGLTAAAVAIAYVLEEDPLDVIES